MSHVLKIFHDGRANLIHAGRGIYFSSAELLQVISAQPESDDHYTSYSLENGLRQHFKTDVIELGDFPPGAAIIEDIDSFLDQRDAEMAAIEAEQSAGPRPSENHHFVDDEWRLPPINHRYDADSKSFVLLPENVIRANFDEYVDSLAEAYRSRLVAGATPLEISGYMINQAVVRDVEGGTAIDDLLPIYLEKIDTEIALDPRYETRAEIVAEWRIRARLYFKGSAIAQGMRAQAKAALASASIEELEAVFNGFTEQAEQAFNDLLAELG